MDEKQLQEALDKLKSELASTTKAEAKAELDIQIKSLESRLEKSAKENQPDIAPLKKELSETKTALETTKAELKTVQETLVTKDAADKLNQEAIDKMQTELKEIKQNKGKQDQPQTLGKALNDALNEGDNFKNLDMLANNHKDRNKKFSIELKTVGDMSITSNYTGGSRALQVLSPGIVMNPPRKVHIRALVPGGSIGPGTSYVFMKESGTGEGDPAFTAESTNSSTGAKPKIDFDLVESSVNIETLAGILQVSRKAMNNIPGFISFLNTRLPERLLRVEDSQLLNGDGVSPNIKGIMRSGNYTAATSTSSFLGEQLIDGIAQLEDTLDRSATGILLRPVDYYSFFKHKATTSGEYDLPKNFVFVDGVLYISGVPVFASTGMLSDQYVIGDWQQGAQLLTQEAMRVEFFEQDSDNVQRNKITVRIEETVAFPVYGSSFFIVGSAGS